MTELYLPEGMRLDTPENRAAMSSRESLNRAMVQGSILEGVATLCDSRLDLHVDLGCVEGIIPRAEAVRLRPGEEPKDIAIITRVGKTVCFKVTGFDEAGRAILSRRAAQADCAREYLAGLTPGDIIPARVTHLEPFGAFVDIGCGLPSLLSIDCISVSRISHPRDRFSGGMFIPVVVRAVDRAADRIYVTHRELLGTWAENAARFSPGQTVAGIVRSVESYGVFVELAPNLAGLAELSERTTAALDLTPGRSATVYIKSIIPERMKVKLVLIDTYPALPVTHPPRCFVDTEAVHHLDRWQYSPPSSLRVIETVFG